MDSTSSLSEVLMIHGIDLVTIGAGLMLIGCGLFLIGVAVIFWKEAVL
jgi:hypothetical protein